MSQDLALSRFHQPISIPGRRLMLDVRLPFVAKRARGGGERAVNQEIPLIPFIDFLLCIVLFLLASFSATSEVPPDKSIHLPGAANVMKMTDAPTVSIAGTQILVDGSRAGSTQSIEDANRMQRVDELFHILKNKRELWKQLNPGREFPGVAVLQVDRKVPALVVKSVFQTAAMAGYPSISFMVQRLGSPN